MDAQTSIVLDVSSVATREELSAIYARATGVDGGVFDQIEFLYSAPRRLEVTVIGLEALRARLPTSAGYLETFLNELKHEDPDGVAIRFV
jgi:hypothetical protein